MAKRIYFIYIKGKLHSTHYSEAERNATWSQLLLRYPRVDLKATSEDLEAFHARISADFDRKLVRLVRTFVR